ncbi:serine/threonine-protein kinase RsbW [Paenarthrobacter nicotinovorans]|jgi:serine/threonine-protein kinase RsbW|uniref:Serine/threonine-protein kinase RsbW n=1 Tax=Paenarthrobacter nicotinovorans TaxID=29320 RepID=A0ABT9TLL2_PAENI|nr:ATP-binding protein [Paenarthrobacter nicotinovorans]MDQ0102547.1 serine/threonine-protein kinase RsbW [Paenarthrobacter nicotinovorans]GAT87943.1 anti-sigma regulatory factor, serine/threonine protein kinase [Paenarthrobacter nicotinovorans]
MTDVLARRGYHGPSNDDAIEAIHNELDSLWDDASFVPDMDRMTFATAVIEAAANIVQHALPVAEKPVEIDVDISVRPARLIARVSAFNAREPFADDMQASMPDAEAESGRGLALIEALVTTVTFERQDGTNTWILTRNT